MNSKNYIILINRILNRKFSSKIVPENAIGYNKKPEVEDISQDYIGPPDATSNLRPVLQHIPENETNLHREYRLERIEVERWNQEFWTNHNNRFYTEREEFIAANRKDDSDTLSADEMSKFYKAFLDKNWKMHFYYNMSWYIKNFTLLQLAVCVKVQKGFRKLKK